MISIIFGLAGIGAFVWAFRLKGLPIMTNIGFAVGCISLILAIVTINAPKGGPDCYIDWDGRSNSTVCD